MADLPPAYGRAVAPDRRDRPRAGPRRVRSRAGPGRPALPVAELVLVLGVAGLVWRLVDTRGDALLAAFLALWVLEAAAWMRFGVDHALVAASPRAAGSVPPVAVPSRPWQVWVVVRDEVPEMVRQAVRSAMMVSPAGPPLIVDVGADPRTAALAARLGLERLDLDDRSLTGHRDQPIAPAIVVVTADQAVHPDRVADLVESLWWTGSGAVAAAGPVDVTAGPHPVADATDPRAPVAVDATRVPGRLVVAGVGSQAPGILGQVRRLGLPVTALGRPVSRVIPMSHPVERLAAARRMTAMRLATLTGRQVDPGTGGGRHRVLAGAATVLDLSVMVSHALAVALLVAMAAGMAPIGEGRAAPAAAVMVAGTMARAGVRRLTMPLAQQHRLVDEMTVSGARLGALWLPADRPWCGAARLVDRSRLRLGAGVAIAAGAGVMIAVRVATGSLATDVGVAGLGAALATAALATGARRRLGRPEAPVEVRDVDAALPVDPVLVWATSAPILLLPTPRKQS